MKNLGILRTCKQIKAEAEEIFYKRNTFKMRRSGGRLQVLNAEFHETGMSLRKFHDILSATPFDLIKRLEISLSSSDGPAESLWASCGRTRYFIRVPDETEEKYLDEVDPQFMTKYAQLCLTENDTLYDRGLRLFASWISMLDHIMTMPALRELIMNFEPIYRWGHYPIGPHDPIIPIDVPHADIEVLAMEALATRMRDRKKSTLGMITVTVDISAWCIMQGGVPIPMTVFLEKHKIWKHIGDDKYQASTMDCDLDYSPEPQWSCSSVKKAYGYWWPSTTQPYRIPIREFKHANLWIKSN
ncbi:hypothetical protein BU16DRAFT_521145 [Lophium mytilinum]|uniref:Uncharacterized protein n=1 Tax=Lophium mytilinum TaxID=390894 RepID=A0A6A6RG06_9PEZI|nr:hypothetical protein BU16DRAFT_521145 [Lophium mytilinum]